MIRVPRALACAHRRQVWELGVTVDARLRLLTNWMAAIRRQKSSMREERSLRVESNVWEERSMWEESSMWEQW